jgi:hypothetical protein
MMEKKRLLFSGILILFMVLALTLPVHAQDVASPPGTIEQQQEQEERPTANLSWSFYSKYVWRGYELSADSLVMFPSITISYKGFAMNMWGDMDTSYKGNGSENSDSKWWETDWILTYSNSWKKFNYTLGWIYYDIDPSTFDRASQEVFTTLGFDVLLKPSLSIYREIALPGERWYINLGVSHSFPTIKREIFGFCGEQSLDVGAWISYMSINSSDYDYEAMHDANIWAAYNIPISSYMTVVPSINYSLPMSNNAQTNIRQSSFNATNRGPGANTNSSWVYGGVTLKVAF